MPLIATSPPCGQWCVAADCGRIVEGPDVNRRRSQRQALNDPSRPDHAHHYRMGRTQLEVPAAVRAGHDPCVAESQAPDVLLVGWTRPDLRTSPMPSRSRSSPSRPGPPVPTPARLRPC